MSTRKRKPSYNDSRETTLLLGLVIVSVVLPTVGFLWFMARAMDNERAAMREQSLEMSQAQLAEGQRLVEAGIKQLASGNDTLLSQANLTEEQRFHRLSTRGLADTLICLGPDGEPTYPFLAESLDESDLTDADQKAMALIEDWDQADGYPSLLTAFENDRCESGRDWNGRYLYPNLQLTAVEALATDSAVTRKIALDLCETLARRDLPWPVGQRLYLADSLRRLGYPVEMPSEAGYRLAAEVLEYPLQLGRTGVLQPIASMQEAWRLLSDDRKFLLVFRTATIQRTLESAAHTSPGKHAMAITVTPAAHARGQAMPVGAAAPEWSLRFPQEVLGTHTDLRQRRAFMLAIGCMLVALIGVIATFAIRRFLAQSRLTQLRNDFLSTISHELKTPLASTRMLVDTLVGGSVNDPDKTRNYLEVIGRENARLSHLVENFLTYSRLESGRMPFDFQDVMPEDVANQALDALESKLCEESVVIQASFAEDLPYIRADEATLCIALMNLLDNAYKYTGAKKAIRLDVRMEDHQVRFAVQDNGIGLNARQRERVRERFYRVNEGESHGGSGLGLSIVSDIAEAHHGELLIESLPGEGSIFTLAIPISGNR